MKKLEFAIRAVRAPFFTATLVPVFLGGSLAYRDGFFSSWKFLETLFAVLFLHAGTNLANDFFDDLHGTDRVNQEITPFSGGSRVIQEGKVAASTVFLSALVCFSLGALLGLHLYFVTGGVLILILGLIGIISGFFYTAPPFLFAHRGFGELLVGLNFGPLVVVGTYYVLAGSVSREALVASLPLGLLIASVLYINQFPDYEADKKTGKRNFVVRLGKEKAKKGYFFLLFLPYALLLSGVLTALLSWSFLLALASFPLALKSWKIVSSHFHETEKLVPALAQTIQIHLMTGILLIFAALLS